jgi:hypothetical protein
MGVVHALANPLGAWQSIKGVFSWMGNRKGQLTPALNRRLLTVLAAACAAPETAAIKKDVLQRSKQVKSGIHSCGGPKRFFVFGKAELAGFLGVGVDAKQLVLIDLTELSPASKALDAAALSAQVQEYHLHSQRRRTWKCRPRRNWSSWSIR